MSITRILFLTILFTLLAALPSDPGQATALLAPEQFSCVNITEIPQAECEALVALYNSTDGPSWDDSTGWLDTNTPCSWYGVTCGGGHITELNLSGAGNNRFGLRGNLPAEIDGLTNLASLNLDRNQLSGVPAAIGNLSNLTELVLSFNLLNSLPADIGKLSNLTKLSAAFNRLSSLPAEIGDLTNLTELQLTGNQLSSLPIEIGDLNNLTVLGLHVNRLSSLPPEIWTLTNLTDLYLYNNQLSSLPAEIGDLDKLTGLYISGNQLSSLPAEIWTLNNLTTLWLHSNKLNILPAEIENLTNLTRLQLNANQLRSLPSELANLNNLASCIVYDNSITLTDSVLQTLLATPCINANWQDTQTIAPSEVAASTLSDSSIQLTWTPVEYRGGHYEISYATAANGPYTIHGITVDKSTSGYELTGLNPGTTYYIRIRTYSPPHSIGDTSFSQQNELWSDYSEIVSATTGGGNNFCAGVNEIPQSECEVLVKLYNSTGGDSEWTNKTNWFDNNQPCSWFGIKCDGGHVIEVRLHENNLVGTIPPDIENLTKLKTLYLRTNQLKGTIPAELGNLADLILLDLSTNELNGSIPATLGGLESIQRFTLHNNELTGSVPASLGDLKNVEYLSVSYNQLTGAIPNELGDLSQFNKLQYLYLNDNQLSGTVPSELGNLSSLTVLTLRTNLLAGPLPNNLTSLSSLTEFHFNNTQLCEPNDPTFQSWLTSINDLRRTQLCTSTAGEIDLVFVIDESGSMGTYQNIVKQNVNVIVRELIASQLDGRFGLVGFGAASDHKNQNTSNGQPHIHTPLIDVNTFSAEVDTLTSGGWYELGFQAVSTATGDAMNFRPDAGKCIVLISDEDADPEGETARTDEKNQAIADLESRDAIFFSIIYTGEGRPDDNITTHADYGSDPSSLAQVTGGRYWDIETFENDTTTVLEELTGACVAAALPGKICGLKYNDLNGNGTQDSDEPGLPNWEIFATDGFTSLPPVTTDNDGNYCIQVPPGTYRVEEIQQLPWLQTAPVSGGHNVTIQSGQTINNIDFGNREPNVLIQGHKFWDLNGNGVRDQITEISGVNIQEPLLDGFSFSLYSGDPNDPTTWTYVAGPATITDPNLGYVFDDIPPGDYFILEDARVGWAQTAPSQNNGAHVITVSGGQDILDLDFGNKICTACEGYVMGYKFIDQNYNGEWDTNEAGLRVAGVQIELVDAADNIVQTTVTDANGLYYFLNVPQGEYIVREQVPTGWLQTAPANGGIHTVTIGSGTNGVGLNFGNYRCDDIITITPQAGSATAQSTACVIGNKFHDTNNNGVKDSGEEPLPDFFFRLQSIADPTNVHFTTSDNFGNFHFIVPQGTYLLYEFSKPHWVLTAPPTNGHVVSAIPGVIADGFEFGNTTCESITGNAGACDCDIQAVSTPIQPLTVGQRTDYTLNIKNVGNAASIGPTSVYFTLPSSLDLVEEEFSEEGWTCQGEYPGVRCLYNEPLQPQEESGIQVAVEALQDIGSEIQTCVTAIARNDANADNNTACMQSEVIDTGEADDANIYLTPADGVIVISDTYTVEIRIDNIEELYGNDLSLMFDPEIIEVVEIQHGDFFIQDRVLQNTHDNDAGTIQYSTSFQGEKPGIDGSGVLARVVFRGLATGISPISFTNVLLSNPQSEAIEAVDKGGQITVVTSLVYDVSGQVLLERRGDNNNSGAEVCVDDKCVTTDDDGSYELKDVSFAGEVKVQRPSYLHSTYLYDAVTDDVIRNRSGGAIANTINITDVTLLGGDINQDGIINLDDGVLVGKARNSTPADSHWYGPADVTDDDNVNLLDMVAVQFNWRGLAPTPWGNLGALVGSNIAILVTPEDINAKTQASIAPTTATIEDLNGLAQMDIAIADVTDLYGFTAIITFDPNKVQVVDANPDESGVQIQIGDLLDTANQIVLAHTVDNQSGRIELSITQTGPVEGKSGNGTIGTVTFEAIGTGQTTVKLDSVRLLDSATPAQVIPVNMEDGTLQLPVADVTVYLPVISR